MQHNPNGLFPVLEKILKAAGAPMDCQSLYDIPEVQRYAASVNRVSDYLGGLWRKGLVVRLPAPKDGASRARWMYEWKVQAKKSASGGSVDHVARVIADRPSLHITEYGGVMTLEFPHLVITIRQRNIGTDYLTSLKGAD